MNRGKLWAEVVVMPGKNQNYRPNKVKSSMNPQGKTEDDLNHEPKSQLEQRAKKKNTKI